MIELSPADKETIAKAAWSDGTPREQQENVFRDGIAAGIERAAKRCEQVGGLGFGFAHAIRSLLLE